jgi:hypothetical protein
MTFYVVLPTTVWCFTTQVDTVGYTPDHNYPLLPSPYGRSRKRSLPQAHTETYFDCRKHTLAHNHTISPLLLSGVDFAVNLSV